MKLDLNQTKTTNKKIKVVFVITALNTGGAEMMLYKFLTRIDRDRFSPTVISMIESGVFVDRIKDLDISVHFLNMQPGIPNPLGVVKLGKLIDEIQPDIVQGWMYHANLYAQLANSLSKSKAPVFWSIHHSVDSLKAEKLSLAATIKATALLSKKAEKVVFSADRGQAQHIKLGYYPNNTIAIGDNFDLSKYKPVLNPEFDLRKFLNLSEDSILIGSVARYHPMKDHANLINGAAELVKKNSNVHFVLVGPNVDSQNPVLSEHIQRLGISEHIHLLGERQDIPDLMTSLDIFTTSSAYGESFPNVLGEAMSCQIPCVSTDIGDSKTIVGETGIVVPPKDPKSLAEAWNKLVILGKEGRHNLGFEARKRIETNFDIDSSNSFVKKYEDIYEVALSS